VGGLAGHAEPRCASVGKLLAKSRLQERPNPAGVTTELSISEVSRPTRRRACQRRTPTRTRDSESSIAASPCPPAAGVVAPGAPAHAGGGAGAHGASRATSWPKPEADWAEPVQKERHAQTVAPTVTLVTAPDHPWRRRQSRGPWSKPAPAPSRILPPLRFRSPLCDFARLSHDVIRSLSPPFTLVSTENVWHFICGHSPQRPSPPARPEDANEPSYKGGDSPAIVSATERDIHPQVLREGTGKLFLRGRPERVKGTGKTEGR